MYVHLSALWRYLITTPQRMHPGSGPDEAIAVKGNLANQSIKATYEGSPYVKSPKLFHYVSDISTVLMYARPRYIISLH